MISWVRAIGFRAPISVRLLLNGLGVMMMMVVVMMSVMVRVLLSKIHKEVITTSH